MRGLPKGLAELDDQVAVYLPMGYMIGGYTVFVPRSWTTPVDMSVEEAMRLALSPSWPPTNHEPPRSTAARVAAPHGGGPALGRPGGRTLYMNPHAPPLRGSLPPTGAGLPWGGPAAGP
jgi:hypothetical protein